VNPIGAKTLNEFGSHLAWLKDGKTPVGEIGRNILARRFPSDARCRILLAYQADPLAYPQFYPFLRYGARFAEHGMHFRAIPTKSLTAATLPPDLDAIFLQSSYTPEVGDLEALLRSIKEAQPNVRISYFDWFAPTDIRFAQRVEPWVAAYVKKSLLSDDAYLTPTESHTNLTEHYGERLGIATPARDWQIPPAIIDKLDVSPAFSTGPSMIRLFEMDSLPETVSRPIDLQARIATKGTPWYSAMRQEAKDALAGFHDLVVASEGRIPQSEFMNELRRSKLCFSPFGYGEICWRDFEAIACGAVLVKPDMSHVRAQPDIYRPFETYIPVRWDLADLNDRVREALASPETQKTIADAAYATVRDHLRGPALEQLAARLSGCE
jgi:hypothetical protein